VAVILYDDTGLIAAIFMGLSLANQRGFDLPARRPFFETLVQLIIGVLFISISATVTPHSLRHLVLRTLALVAVLVIAARPSSHSPPRSGPTCRKASARSWAGWPRAGSWRPPRPPRSRRAWSPRASAAPPRSSRPRSW
jgi:NhaP-type Na+/H+ or K+/H+ antiporter